PAELAQLLSGLSKITEKFAIEGELVNAAGKCVGGEEHRIRYRRDAEGPGGARSHRPGSRSGLVPDGRTSISGCGNINGDHAEKFSFAIENLNAPIAAVGNVDISLRVYGNTVRRIQLAGLVAGFAKRLQPVTVLVGFRHARIDVTIADKRVARGIPR